MTRIDINLNGVYKKLDTQNIRKGKYAVANQALSDMNPFVPKDEGILRMATSIDIDGSGINYHMPYASELFYVPKYNYTTPGTGPRWDIKATRLFMSDWIKAFSKGAGWY